MDKYEHIELIFENNEDKDNAAEMADYMRNQFIFYGIPSSKRKGLYSDILKNEKKNKRIDWDLLDICNKNEHREFQYFIIDYLTNMQKCLTYEDIQRILPYIKTRQWWDTIDAFDKIIGDIGLKDDRVDDLMLEWSLSDDIWLRRIAIDHQLGRKEKTNTILLKRIIVNNLGSQEFFINKAIGWSLRDYSKTNPEWVKNFIDKYKDRLDRLSIKEGSKYL